MNLNINSRGILTCKNVNAIYNNIVHAIITITQVYIFADIVIIIDSFANFSSNNNNSNNNNNNYYYNYNNNNNNNDKNNNHNHNKNNKNKNHCGQFYL